MVLILGVVALAAILAAPQSQPGPPTLPFVLEDFCPGECCRYDANWRTTASVTVRSERRDSGKAVGVIDAGRPVTALRGALVVSYAPPVKVLHADWLDVWSGDRPHPSPFPGKAGDLIYILGYHGEGRYAVWHEGRVITRVKVKYDTAKDCAARGPCSAQLQGERDVEMEWWVLLRDRGGKQGWTKVDYNLATPGCH